MDPSLLGVLQRMAVTVRQCKISWGVYSRFKPQVWPLLPFWKMDLSLPGVMQSLAVTVVCLVSRCVCQMRHETRLLCVWPRHTNIGPSKSSFLCKSVARFQAGECFTCAFFAGEDFPRSESMGFNRLLSQVVVSKPFSFTPFWVRCLTSTAWISMDIQIVPVHPEGCLSSIYSTWSSKSKCKMFNSIYNTWISKSKCKMFNVCKLKWSVEEKPF